MQRVSDLGDVFRRRRIVAVSRVTDEAIARTDRKHDLRKVRCERDDAVDMLRHDDSSTRIIFERSSQRDASARLRWRTRKRRSEQQRAQKDHEPSELYLWQQRQSPADPLFRKRKTGISGT